MSNVSATYSRGVKAHDLLSKEDEVDLARRYKSGDQAAGDAIITHNLRFALRMAHRYTRFGHPIEDLVQEANLGLISALKKYDPERGLRFVTYAVWWIEAKLKMYVTKNVSLVKYGTTMVERGMFGKIGAVHSRIQHANPKANDDEIFQLLADELGLDFEQAKILHQRTTGYDLSLAAKIVGDVTHQDMLTRSTESIDDQLDNAKRDADLRRLVMSCARTTKERYIAVMRILAEEPMTFQSIADVFGLSRERVRQIEAQIIRRVRDLL